MDRYAGYFLTVSALILSACGNSLAAEERLFSENTAALFAKQAQELYQLDPLNSRQVEQAMTLLDAAIELDERSTELPQMVLTIGASACFTGKDYTPRLAWALERYVGSRTDLQVTSDAVKCMLEHLNSREEREKLLGQLLNKYHTANPAFASELATQLGLLAAEKADNQQAVQDLSIACSLNRYNQLAFVKLQELTAGQNLTVKPEAYIVQLRTALDINPYDLRLAMFYGQALLRQQLYEQAEKAYDYAWRLYQGAASDRPLPDDLLTGWLTSCYLTPSLQSKCVELADKYRQKDRLNLTLEALAGKAAAKMGQVDKARSILENAAGRAERLLQQTEVTGPIQPEELAWFYSFALQQPEKALAWSNQAYQQAPDRPGVRALFAYTLAQSGQNELAQKEAEPLKDTDQVAALTMALVQMSQDNKTQAIETLRAAIAMEPYSFVAEKAFNMLGDLGSDYVQPLAVESVRNALEAAFGNQIMPDFMPPSKRFTARLLFSGSEFFYAADFGARVIIENIGTGPLVITDEAFLNGRIRVDAFVRGDLQAEIPNIVLKTVRPSKPIMSGEHLSIPLDVQTGKLLRLLRTYPQASFEIEFVLYLDPVTDNKNQPANNLKDIAPVRAIIRRPGVSLTRDFLMQRLETLAKGQEGQRFRAVELLTGLLAEQRAFQFQQATFQHAQAEHTILVDTVRKALADDNWKIRVLTMDSLMTLDIPLEFGMVPNISKNLTYSQWPVRLMAMLVLAKAQPETFDKVLDWAAQSDTYGLNRRMAMALTHTPPQAAADPNLAEAGNPDVTEPNMVNPIAPMQTAPAAP
ncbi:MAG: hypothetical protein LLF76_13300 [Planctomycetaceae bacterium]|nr:hypothetical protein [Planctomycetaceae bacterium]